MFQAERSFSQTLVSSVGQHMHIYSRDHAVLRRLDWNYCVNSVNVHLTKYGVTMAQKRYAVYCLRCARLLGIPHDVHHDMT